MTLPFTRKIIHRGRKIQVGLDTGVSADRTPFTRDVVVHPGAVAILPFVDRQSICLVRNVRPIVGETLLEIPAGTLEANELPQQAAVRELAEETGYRAERWEKLADFFPSPGVLTETTHLFIARDLTPGPMNLEPDEELQPVVVPITEALEWVKNGAIRDAKTMIALMLWSN